MCLSRRLLRANDVSFPVLTWNSILLRVDAVCVSQQLKDMEEKKRPCILVVDDEPLLVRLNKRQLENNGYDVQIATESSDALRIFTESPDLFDLMISDLTMPKMSGRELIKRILNIAPDLPVIVFTGMKDENVAEELSELGVKCIVEKPVVKNELLDAVNSVFTPK